MILTAESHNRSKMTLMIDLCLRLERTFGAFLDNRGDSGISLKTSVTKVAFSIGS